MFTLNYTFNCTKHHFRSFLSYFSIEWTQVINFFSSTKWKAIIVLEHLTPYPYVSLRVSQNFWIVEATAWALRYCEEIYLLKRIMLLLLKMKNKGQKLKKALHQSEEIYITLECVHLLYLLEYHTLCMKLLYLVDKTMRPSSPTNQKQNQQIGNW